MRKTEKVMGLLVPKLGLKRELQRARYAYQLGRKRMGRGQYIVLRAALALVLMGASLSPVAMDLLHSGTAHADGETINGGGAVNGRVNQQIAISDISIGGTGDDTVPVKLTVDSGTLWLGTTTGLTFTGPTSGAMLQFSGARSDVNTALATLHYASQSAGSDTLEVSLAEADQVYDSANGHVYQYISGSFNWQQAHDDAAAATYQGVPGYLATITSLPENQFIQSKLSGDAWLGASDADQFMGEGHWSWVDGPEQGTNFYNGEGSGGANDGIVVGSNYTNWAGGEPNQAGDEDCMETYISSGTWNDFPCSAGLGYVVEFGAPGNLPSGIPTKDVSITTTDAVFAGGDGSAETPYQITDCERLQDMNQDLSAHYVLTHNIDCTETTSWNGGQGFVPVGDGENEVPFTGTLDGAGYSIDGLTEIRADDDVSTDFWSDPATNQRYIGLFGFTSDATVTDVHLTSAMIKGYEYVGGLVGYMENGTISGSSVNSNISQPDGDCTTHPHCVWARYGWYGGGLVGYTDGGQISDSETGGPVKGSGHVIGGLVGYMDDSGELTDSTSSSPADGGEYIGGAIGEVYDSSLQNVSTSGDILATLVSEDVKYGQEAGGLIGYGSNVTVDHSRATGTVHADNYDAGGLAGELDSSNVTDSYATGDVYAEQVGGGLIGNNQQTTVARAYASGSVEGDTTLGAFVGATYSGVMNDSFAVGSVPSGGNTGGFAGYDNGESTYSQDYFDADGTTHTDCNGDGPADGCTGINTAGYFVNKANVPFTQSGSEVWLGSVWNFDGTHLPVFGQTVPDDHDGISNATEDAAPNSGDANNDGTPDSQQANVTSLIDPVTGHYATVAVSNSCDLSNVSVKRESSLASSDKDYDYPLGLLDFTADCGTPGFTTTVTQYYYNPPSGDFLLRKFIGGDYRNVSGATVSRQTIGGQSALVVSYQVTDGGPLDADGLVNGTIVDPAGPAVAGGATLTSTGENLVLIATIALLFIAAAVTVQRSAASQS